MSYTDQNLIEAFLQRSLSSNEASLLNLVISAVDSYINDQIGGSYGTVNETTRYYDGGSKILNIDTCMDITSVKIVDEQESLVQEYTLNEDFEARPRNDTMKNWIEKRYGCFPSGLTNIAVTAKFTEGAAIPEDLQYYATWLAGQMFSTEFISNLKSESIEGYSRTFGSLTSNNNAMQLILDKYSKNDITF